MKTLKTTRIYARHGDLVVERLDYPPPLEYGAVTAAPTRIAGSHGKAHTISAGVLYTQEGRDHIVVVGDEPAALTHESTHLPVPLLAGQAYRIYPQIERRGDGDVDVED